VKNLNPRNVLRSAPLYLAASIPATYFSVQVLGHPWGVVFAGVMNLVLLVLLVRNSNVQESEQT